MFGPRNVPCPTFPKDPLTCIATKYVSVFIVACEFRSLWHEWVLKLESFKQNGESIAPLANSADCRSLAFRMYATPTSTNLNWDVVVSKFLSAYL
jgi:hypothetical protein